MAQTRYFNFNWYKNEKYREPIVRNTIITSSDFQPAVYAFRKAFGSLKENTINSIQEITKNGNPIGDSVYPNKDNEE